ncbi:MAG: SusD/RagB family nutrient-binding outer membrane lipoprotein [Draconibacterium sp.]|nr:SusD/RagB family nutrient-binding outer membrane lipoprotein [Draconibacterium sp.]
MMKHKNIYLVLVLLLIFGSSCDDKFAEINKNPNAVTEIDDGYLFSNTVLSTIRGGNNTRLQFPFGSQLGHYYVGQNNAMFIDRYYDYFTGAEYKDLFQDFYYGPIRLVTEVMRFTRPGGERENEVRFAMAQVVAFMNYARLADTFGSVPYIEGGLGQEGFLFPKYNSVEFIYTDMMERLKTIIPLLQNADPAMGYTQEDPLYNNDLKKWARFANSLRLRFAMRARFVAPELANPIIAECLALPLIEELNQAAGGENEDSDLNELGNPMYSHYQYWKWKMSEKFVETLKTTDDPRLYLFVKPNRKGEYVGIPNGLSDQELPKWVWSDVSDPSDTLVGRAASISEMTAAEIWLLRAEAALYNLGPGDANELYRKGIEMSFEQWKVTQEQIYEYMTNADYSTLKGTQEQKFEQICTQLWIAVHSNSHEGWANIRRTGYPRIPQRTEPTHSLGVTNGVLPTRLRYPSSEVNINRENYEAAIAEQGPDLITTHLWWDVRD